MDYFECKLVDYAGAYQVQPQKYDGHIHRREPQDDHPHIRRNPDKCILCGLCVRICEEVAGATAIGFMVRGFDTVVAPAFDADLRDTDCISCGQCVQVCPTGALTEVQMIEKQVPLRETATDTVCSGCSVGCNSCLTSNGKLLLRNLPAGDDGLLCNRGRFSFGDIAKSERVTAPLVRVGNGLEQTGFEDAVARVAGSVAKLQAKHGDDCVALLLSGRTTNEEAEQIMDYAKNTLKTKNVFSFGALDCGPSTADMDDLEAADLVVAVSPGDGILKSVAAMRIRRAVNGGAKLVLVSGDEHNILIDIASQRVDSIAAAKKLVVDAKNPVFIVEGDAKDLPKDARVIRLLPDPNSRGLVNLGVRSGDEYEKATAQGKIKALLIFGDVPEGLDLSAIEFLMVRDLHMTDAARQADVVLPGSSFAEADGSFTGFDNRTRKLHRAVKSPVAWDNIRQIKALAAKA